MPICSVLLKRVRVTPSRIPGRDRDASARADDALAAPKLEPTCATPFTICAGRTQHLRIARLGPYLDSARAACDAAVELGVDTVPIPGACTTRMDSTPPARAPNWESTSHSIPHRASRVSRV
ncbi:hypothetical protein B0H14DRAFT_3513111, partial [Mycena olivaceomarginata]